MSHKGAPRIRYCSRARTPTYHVLLPGTLRRCHNCQTVAHATSMRRCPPFVTPRSLPPNFPWPSARSPGLFVRRHGSAAPPHSCPPRHHGNGSGRYDRVEHQLDCLALERRTDINESQRGTDFCSPGRARPANLNSCDPSPLRGFSPNPGPARRRAAQAFRVKRSMQPSRSRST